MNPIIEAVKKEIELLEGQLEMWKSYEHKARHENIKLKAELEQLKARLAEYTTF